MALAAGTRLGPYEILLPIGAGGMGEVWKALDTRLNRIVAIKRLKGPQSARFEQEARAIASLNHPHICQIYDVGPDYLVLEYVEGVPLRGPVGVDESVRLAMQIAGALEAAHKRGILHRDLKPANVLITESGAKLLDFGLAKPVAHSDADVTKTVEGTVLGTAAYMSPEQAQGKAVDARSDVFSFGAVLYELLSGTKAFTGGSMVDILSAVVRDEPAPLKAPEPLARIVSCCLKKSCTERFQTMTEVHAALEQIAVTRTVAKQAGQPSIAVLPFANMSADPEQEYFSDGLAEEIINALTQVSGLKVIARTSAFAFKGKNEDIRKIAEALGVTNVLEGSVRSAGGRIRVTAQLIQASEGTHLWSQRFDREMVDVFAVQDEITGMVVNALKVRLVGDIQTATFTPPNVDAYTFYLKGRYQQNRRTPESLHKSIANFREAIALDPCFASAYCGLAESYSTMAYNEVLPPREAMPKAKAAAQQALARDATMAAAHACLGDVMSAYEWDWEGGEEEFRLAIRLNPGDALAHDLYASASLAPRGRWQEVLSEMHRALELDPVSPLINRDLGGLLFLKRDYDQAIEQLHRTRDLDPDFIGIYYWLGRAYEQNGMPEQALAAFEQRLLRGKNTRVLAAIGHLHAVRGNRTEALARTRELEESSNTGRVPSLDLATMYIGLGETDQAIEFLVHAFEERSAAMYHLKVDPIYDPLRGDERFTALLDRMRLQ